MSEVVRVVGREIIDSRGNPTVEAEVYLKSGHYGRAAVPSGASTGSREAIELRDGDKKRYLGKGVLHAVEHINGEIYQALANTKFESQSQLDSRIIELDGTENKSRLGANALLGVSMAFAYAQAASQNQNLFEYLNHDGAMSLPVPMMNILNGGAHADNSVDIQEFMIMPVGSSSLREAIRCGAEIFHSLKKVLQERGLNTAVGDEGGFAPDLVSNEAALEVIVEAVDKTAYHLGQDVVLALDVASSELYSDGYYHLSSENRKLSAAEFVEYLEGLAKRYPIYSIEDGMDESDWDGWKLLTERIGRQVQLVGDDLFVTNSKILQQGIDQNIANAILIKVNQIGTLTETLEAISLAKSANYNNVISHRSGETEDTTIADLAVATGAGQIKTGSLSRSDRIAKYNQLIRIEEKLANHAHYPGRTIFNQLDRGN